MNNGQDLGTLIEKMRDMVRHIRFSIDKARETGEPKGAILADAGDRGRIISRFDIEQFLNDLETLFDVSPTTLAELTKIRAMAFNHEHALAHDHTHTDQCCANHAKE